MQRPVLKSHCFAAILFLFLITPGRGHAQQGGILQEIYSGIPGSSIADLFASPAYPDNPTSTNIIRDVFEAPSDFEDNYGQRMRGFIVPPITGNYIFWIASDDQSLLSLSTDDNPANSAVIASVSNWTASRDWLSEPNQMSAPIRLEASRTYYIEAVMKEGSGGDNLAVRWQLPNGAIEEPIPASRLFPPGLLLAAPTISAHPTSVVAEEGGTAAFHVRVRNSDPVTYQWQRNGVNIPGASFGSFTNFLVTMADNGAQYRALITNTLGSVFSSEAALFVLPDEKPPLIQSVHNIGVTSLVVAFSEPVEAATPQGAFAILPGVIVQRVLPGADAKTLILETAPLQAGGNYTLIVNGIRDRAAARNLIAANTRFEFTVLDFAPRDIGKPNEAGGVVARENGFDVTGGGREVGGLGDQFQFSFQERTGDFDFKVRVQSIEGGNPFAQAGLMVRESLAPNSRSASVLATPNIAGAFFLHRSIGNTASISTGSFPVNYPDTWLRLRRATDLFSGYASFDGENWSPLGSTTIQITNAVFFGLAVSSHDTNGTVVAEFRDFGPITGRVQEGVARESEPPGPSSRRTGLVFSEIMYRPEIRADGRNLEFLEIFNTQPFYEDLSDYRIAGAVEYQFPKGTILKAGAMLLVGRSPADLTAIYGITNVVGGYTGALQNGNGTLRLLNRQGAVLLDVTYSDQPPWPVAADGAGHSLVLARPSRGEADWRAWEASAWRGGSPGRLEGVARDPLRKIVINELLANSDAPALDFVELFNRGSEALDLSGCILSDDPSEPRFRIPGGTIIAPHGWVRFTQIQLGFALSSAGERVLLMNPRAQRVLDAIRFGPQAAGVAFGRFPDGAPEWSELASPTAGARNNGLLTREVVINEILYNPISNEQEDEFVELHNRGSAPVPLGGWRLADGIEFEFAPGAVLPPGGYLVVAKNRSRLIANHPGLAPSAVVGDYAGNLSNSGERIVLERPETGALTNAAGAVVNTTIYLVMDEVTYGEGGRWGQWSDGGGSSLELTDPLSDNRQAANWQDSDESGSSAWVTVEHTGVLDHGTAAYPIDAVQALLLGEGECLIDNVEVLDAAGVNLVVNSTFESGATGWTMRGTHTQSRIRNGEGFQSIRSLHMVATARGDSGPNQVVTPLKTPLRAGSTATIRAKVRWLRGHPEILLRLHGNHLEAPGNILTGTAFGTPGARNSRAVANAGPAISDVAHWPVLPAANQSVVVTARIADPQGVSSAVLRVRFDPSVTTTSIPMRDDGSGGDATANDGVFSATLPGQATGVMAAFHVQAFDASGSRVDSIFPVDAPRRECLLQFGETQPAGSFGTYRIWVTQATLDEWTNRHPGSNEPLDATFVYGDTRAVYNARVLYSGSPWHWRGYTSPISDTCNYMVIFPADDRFLGTTDFVLNLTSNQGSDNTAIREQTFYWMADQLNHPYTYRRFHHMFFNGVRRGVIYEDSQQPSREFIEEWYPGDPEGELYKIEDWFEYDSEGFNFANTDGSLENFVTTGQQKKLARYRWTWRKRAVQDSANDYTELFALVDAMNTVDPDLFTRAVDSLVDVEEWARAIVLRHVVGDWDAYGYSRGKNMYGYKPVNGKWQLLHWDIAFSFGLGHATNRNLFETIEPVVRRLFLHPPFRRLYFQAMQEALDSALSQPKVDPVMNARYAALQGNDIPVTAPTAIRNYINGRRRYIEQVISTNDAPFAITTAQGQGFSTSDTTITLEGTAPFRVKTIQMNGIAYPVSWTTTSNWTTRLPLGASSTLLQVTGLDTSGAPVTGAQRSIRVTYTGPVESAQEKVVINEIMYNPDIPGTEFVELFNASERQAFDLSRHRLEGVDFTFPDGMVIEPRAFVVLVADEDAFVTEYGTGVPVAGAFSGRLDNDGETLTLMRPGGGVGAVVDRVEFDNTIPWPAAADGLGGSLQLIDASEDNDRAGNWAAQGNEWQFVSVTGSASSSTLLISLIGDGEVYVDDLALVAGDVPRVGPNLLRNPGFESPFGAVWTVTAALGAQAGMQLETRRTGLGSLHLVASSGSEGVTVAQSIDPALAGGQTYTLSYWYLPTRQSGRLAVRLSGDGIFSDEQTGFTALRFSTPGKPNATRATLGLLPAVWINEILPDNRGTGVDAFGDPDPWVELFNGGAEAVSLDGYYLTDDYADPVKWAFPAGAVLAPGGFRVIWLDGEPGESTAGEWHASFRAAPSSGSLALYRAGVLDAVLVDYTDYRALGAGASWGLFPDGVRAGRRTLHVQTPGQPNDAQTPRISVFINEWMASNTSILDPADNDPDDWFELFNAGTTSVDLSSYTLTDDLTNPGKWVIPGGTVIAPLDFLLVWADEEAGQNRIGGDLHASFRLSRGGESIALYSPGGALLDSVTFGPQEDGVSQGRMPDGAGGRIEFLPRSSPGSANDSLPVPRILSVGVSNTGSVVFTWNAQAGSAYQIEFRDSLSAGAWLPLGNPIPVNGTTGSFTDNAPANALGSRFYRIVKAP